MNQSEEALVRAIRGLVEAKDFMGLQLDRAHNNITIEEFKDRSRPYFERQDRDLDNDLKHKILLVARQGIRDPEVLATAFGARPDDVDMLLASNPELQEEPEQPSVEEFLIQDSQHLRNSGCKALADQGGRRERHDGPEAATPIKSQNLDMGPRSRTPRFILQQICHLLMRDDPTNLPPMGRQKLEQWVDRQAQKLGFENWVELYHARWKERKMMGGKGI